MRKDGKTFICGVTICVLSIVGAWSGDVNAQTEDDYVGGPNRRLETTKGYGSVTASITRSGELWSATANDKPTIYFGLSEPIHIDAGLVYEPVPVNTTGVPNRSRKGWGVFLKQKTNTYPSVDAFSRWMGDVNGNEILDAAFGTRTMTFRTTSDNRVVISVEGMRSYNRPEPKINSDFSNMVIKRIVGITQAVGQVNKNGSRMIGSKIDLPANAVGKWKNTANGWELIGEAWPTNSPSPKYLPSGKQRIGTRFIIDLDAPWQRNSNGTDQDIHNHVPSRLNTETVNVDLRNSANVKGKYGTR